MIFNRLIITIIIILSFSRVYGTESENDKSEYNMDNSRMLLTLGTGLAEYTDKDVKHMIPVFFSYQERSGLTELFSSMVSIEAENVFWFFHAKEKPADKKIFDQISLGPRYWFTHPMLKFYAGFGVSVIAVSKEVRDDYGSESTEVKFDFGPYVKSGYTWAFNESFGFDLGIRYDVYNFKKGRVFKQPVVIYAGVNYRYCN